jgi:predicted XRE-type DNA-binding protein
MPSNNKPRKVAKARMGSGNVFHDLGLSEPGERLAKAQLTNRICDAIADLKLTQAEAAKLMRLDQPKVSALLRGKLSGFSLERLFRCLNDLGQDVSVTVQPVRGHRQARTRVLIPSHEASSDSRPI